MILKNFAILILAHLLGDIIFASYRLSLLKRRKGFLFQLLGLGVHALIHALFAGIFLIVAGANWARGALLIFVIHYMIDLIRSSAEKKIFGYGQVYVKRSEFIAWVKGKSDNPEKMNIRNLRTWFLLNFLDQGAHLVSLYVIAHYV